MPPRPKESPRAARAAARSPRAHAPRWPPPRPRPRRRRAQRRGDAAATVRLEPRPRAHRLWGGACRAGRCDAGRGRRHAQLTRSAPGRAWAWAWASGIGRRA
eukprot:scaffold109167_cov75-Phaeocystis_antarctica.AAC.3